MAEGGEVHANLVGAPGVEADEQEIDRVREIVRREMEGASDMSVRLEIDMHDGDSWFEAH